MPSRRLLHRRKSRLGLGAITRLADGFDVFSQPDRGTVVRARCMSVSGQSSTAQKADVAGLVTSLGGCEESGDSWGVRYSSEGFSVLAVDGLGHGHVAAEAAAAAIGVFHSCERLTGPDLVAEMDRAMRSTRGAALALAEAFPRAAELRFTGIGNIAGVIYDTSGSHHLVSMNGTVGHRLGAVRQFKHPWSPDSTLVLHSDGVRNRWRLEDYPGLTSKSSAMIAGVIFRDASRGTDDASIVVARTGTERHQWN